MGLEGFSIENEGGVTNASCDDVPQLMIIAGPNGVGKSTLLEALNNRINQNRSDVTVSGDVETVYFTPHRAPNPNDLTASALSSLPNRSSRELLGSSNYDIGSDNSDLPNELTYGHSRSRNEADYAPYFEVKKRLAQFEHQKGNILSEIYDERGEVPPGYIPDFNEPLKSSIEAVLPGVAYQGVEVVDNEYQIVFENRAGTQVGFDELSSGEKDAIAMLFLLLEKQIENLIAQVRGDDPTQEELVILIDSPESHLHPAMQDRFFNYLQDVLESAQGDNLNLQVIACTHSQMILNNSDMDNLYLLMYADQRSGNQLVHADGIEKAILDEFLGDLGVSALSAGKPLLLVEGKTDKNVLTRLDPDLDVVFEITPMGGKEKVLNADDTFTELSAELSTVDIDVFGIIDKDREDISENSGPFYTLPRTCIENFLLDPTVLSDTLSTLVSYDILERQEVQTPDEVADLLEEIIHRDDFKSKEITTRLNENMRFYVDLRSIEEMSIDEIESEIDSVVDTKKDRLQDQLETVEESVDSAIEDSDLENLNGKYIYSEISSEFNISAESLKRTAADKMNNEYRIPSDLAQILSGLYASVDQDGVHSRDSS
ncbi:AAA family ATPase [Halococcus sp. IIIV-5B]|uniref:AAA family ATPase n=1 Tax=Halococcus sp. IIIV-5B TaxID=2321230 RepID=UPI000E74CF84|nr:AAA family ATPase [Halococcus sp. IIIV-5B]RJT04751.1 DUF4435 domain-containing protein [Halococcus sp. IIIV-5B]